MDLGNQLIEMSKGFGGVWQLVFSVIGTILATCLAIEVSPLKFDPLKWLTKAMSRSFKDWFEEIIDSSLDKQLNKIEEENKKRDGTMVKMDGAIKGLTEKVDDISKRMNVSEDRAQANHIAAIKRDILRFADNLRMGVKPSKESFDDIIELHDVYEKYIKENKLTNGRTTAAYQLIWDTYQMTYNHPMDQSKKS